MEPCIRRNRPLPLPGQALWLAGLMVLACRPASFGVGGNARLETGRRIDTFLIDVERITHGVPLERGAVTRYTLTYSADFGAAWLYVSGRDARVIAVGVDAVQRMADALSPSEILGGEDTCGARAPDGVSWRVQARLNDRTGIRCFVRSMPPIVRDVLRLAGDREAE